MNKFTAREQERESIKYFKVHNSGTNQQYVVGTNWRIPQYLEEFVRPRGCMYLFDLEDVCICSCC